MRRTSGAYPGEDPQRTRARKIAQEVTDKRPEPGQIFQRIRDDLHLTEAQTDAMLKDIALEAIMRDPWLWVSGTLEMFYELLKGAPKEEERPLAPGGPRSASGGEPVGALQLLAGGAAARPGQRGRKRPSGWPRSSARRGSPGGSSGLGVVGAVLALVVRPTGRRCCRSWWRCADRASAPMLVGDVPRYRYPVDPLMYVMAPAAW